MLKRLTRWVLACAWLAGCGIGSAEEPQPEQSAHLSAVVDSAFSPEEELRRFTAGVEATDTLSGGATSREALVRRYVGALERHDTAAIRDMALSRAEFAYLYYPNSQYTRPPMRQDPGLVWFQIQQNSEKGIVRALRRYGGEQLGYDSHRCDPEPEVRNELHLWTGCVVEARLGEANVEAYRLFGTIVERGGRFKFVSYANRL